MKKPEKNDKFKQYFELDQTELSQIEERIISPFLRKEDFQFNGYFMKASEIKRIAIKETQKTTV